ncbi:MAG: hypothetical protein ACQCXQ_08765 [Verrucomicrobiales bacterium]|nr:hypothetical protein [Verrucomicrobiota bacterium JB025]
MKSIITFLNRHPWIYVVLAFALLIAAWSTLITIAVKHPAEHIEVESSEP